MTPKVLMLDGRPFLVTAEVEAWREGAPVKLCDGYALEADGAVRSRGSVDPAATTEPTRDELLRLLVDAVFAGRARGAIALPAS